MNRANIYPIKTQLMTLRKRGKRFASQCGGSDLAHRRQTTWQTVYIQMMNLNYSAWKSQLRLTSPKNRSCQLDGVKCLLSGQDLRMETWFGKAGAVLGT